MSKLKNIVVGFAAVVLAASAAFAQTNIGPIRVQTQGSTPAVTLVDPSGQPIGMETTFGVAPTLSGCSNRTKIAPDPITGFWGQSINCGAFTPFGANGSASFNGITSGVNTSAAMVVSTFSTLTPAALGQIAGSQLWMLPGLISPSASISTTGGSIANLHTITVLYTLNDALGETVISAKAAGLSSASCAGGGTQCSVIETVPTIPTGYTGQTVYANDSSTDALFHRIAGCVNIVTNCTITAVGAGVQPPTVGSAFIQPPNMQANNGPPGSVPSISFPKADGNYYPWLGIDYNSCDASGGPPLPCGTPVFTHRTYFSDRADPIQSFKNSFVSINHLFGTGVVTNNQDRALSVFASNPVNDSATRWGLEGMQVEVDFNCNGCNINGSPDSEVSTTSWQLSNLATTGYSTSLGTNAVRAEYFRNGANMDGGGNNVFHGIFANNVSSNPGSIFGAVYRATCANSFVTQAGLGCGGFLFNASANRFLTGQIGLYAFGALVTGTGDWLIRNDIHNFHSNLNGNVGLNEIHMTDLGALPVNASLALTGAATVAQIASGWATGYNGACSGGASSYGYTFVAVDSNGGTSNSAAITSGLATCTNPLTGGNPATLNPLTLPIIFFQAARIDVYRTSGPMGLGKIGTLSCNNNMPIFGCNAFVDTALTATTALPSGNTTGGIASAGDYTFNLSKGQHFNTFAAASDSAGTCTAAAATTCTVTFARAYTSAPVCTATDSTNITTLKVTPSTSSLIITTTGATSDTFTYFCSGNPN